MKTPDFPKEQVALAIVAIAGVCADLGVNIPQQLQTHVLTLITVAYPLVALALAHIRHGRSNVAAARAAAASQNVAYTTTASGTSGTSGVVASITPKPKAPTTARKKRSPRTNS